MDQVRRKMRRFRGLISFGDAIQRMESAHWREPGSESIDSGQAYGRIASGDINAIGNVPRWNRSLVDGFAVRSDQCAGASETNPVTLKVNGIVEAGSSTFRKYRDDSCTEIYTGGVIPEPYDCVVMVEDVEFSEGDILLFSQPSPWENVEREGEDIKRDTIILRKGDPIRPWHVSALVSSGATDVNVFRKLRIGVLSTGNELFPGSEGFIPNTTQKLLVSYLQRGFLDPFSAGIAHDDANEISTMVRDALRGSDCVLITGGTSLGGRDEVPEAMKDLGNVVFAGSMIRPGRTLTLYEVDAKPVFSVSGIPIPALLSFDLYFEKFIEKLLGFRQYRRTVMGRLSQSVSNKAGYMGIFRVGIAEDPGGMRIEIIKTRGSGTLSSIMNADGTLLIPDNVEGYEAGAMVQVKLFGDLF